MGGRQRTTGTLKAFVRVSKNSDGPTVDGKRLGATAVGGGGAKAAGDGASPRMATRSSSSSSSTTIASPVASVRKRKSVDAAQQRSAITPKRVATGGAVAARMATPTASPAASTAKAGRKRNTTIGAYFPAASAPDAGAVKSAAAAAVSHGNGSGECLKEQPEPSSSSLSVSNSISAVEQTDASNEPQPAAADAPEKSDNGQVAVEETSGRKESRLRARTTALLERLRGRKRPTADGDAGGAGDGAGDAGATSETRSSVTRDIQERIRELREAPSAQEPSAEQQNQPHDGATFQAARVRTAADAQLSELRRQFVRIDAPRDAAALSSELRKLEELFQGLEHVTLFGGTANTSAGVVYHKVRRSVEAMARRTFGWRELGQILAVYPEAYGVSPIITTHMGRRVPSAVLTPPHAHGVGLAMAMDERRCEFRRRLVARVADAHSRFLLSRGYERADLESPAVADAGWHPAFDIESVPAVDPLPMPPAPLVSAAAGNTSTPAVAALDKSKLKHLLGLRGSDKTPKPDDSAPNAPAQPATAASISPSSSTPQHPATVDGGTNKDSSSTAVGLPTPSDSPVIHPSAAAAAAATATASDSELSKKKKTTTLAAGAKGLLERIRAKQRAKEEAAFLKSPSSIPASTRSMHSRLPAVLDAISFLYYSERKSVLPFHYVAEKIGEAQRLDRPDAVDHIVALARFVPEWCAVVDEAREDAKEKEKDAAMPSPDARLKIVRALSAKEAKAKLAAKIAPSPPPSK
ncbi:hypothetical protein IWW48_003694 [Coemansia sp. RSA 1200]|nr:hypothetical protein IWW48_003694 [Coemansia sp. RSA 1200]